MMDIDEPISSSEEFENDFEEEADAVEAADVNNEVVEDLTAEECIPSPGSTEALQDGVPTIKARPYQKEMMEESLKKNIIVAVSHETCKSRSIRNACQEITDVLLHRWTLEVGRRMCESRLYPHVVLLSL